MNTYSIPIRSKNLPAKVKTLIKIACDDLISKKYSIYDYKEVMRDNENIFVIWLEYRNRPVTIAVFGNEYDEDVNNYMSLLYVRKGYRNRGCFKKILEYVFTELKYNKIHWSVNPKNRLAKKIYNKITGQKDINIDGDYTLRRERWKKLYKDKI